MSARAISIWRLSEVPFASLVETLRGKPSGDAVNRIVQSRSPAFTVLPVLEDIAREAGLAWAERPEKRDGSAAPILSE